MPESNTLVKELHTIDAAEPAPAALMPAGGALMFERLARDPNVSVEKLRELVALQEHILAREAEAAFWDAFGEMQGDLPTITEDGAIKVGEQIRSRYSTNEAIQEALRPILRQYGFSLGFRNQTRDSGNQTRDSIVVVTGILAHRGGHKETDTFESLPDSGGQMNSIQRIGSTRSYGARYTTISLLNIVSRAPGDRDDDGNRGGNKAAPEPPAGFADWWLDMQSAIDNGLTALEKAWGASRKELKEYAHKHRRAEWTEMKAKARKVRA